ncbi:MAG: 3-hydroxyacyl-CoA dehydrogenase family protein [Spirochaetota bacterium]
METIGVVGAGLMGADVAQLAVESGMNVILHDSDQPNLKAAHDIITGRLDRYVHEGRISSDERRSIASRIKLHNNMKDLVNADFIIECITEDLEAKRELFRQLDKICKPGVIFASNTSALSITQMGAATQRAESVIGMHFMNPARPMKVVELVCGLVTTRETFEMAKSVAKRMGKKCVESKDYPGFVINRIMMPMINEAIFTLYEGAATAQAIDKTMKLGMNLPMGPLELADMIGLDVVLAVVEELYDGFGDPKYRPCPLLKMYVAAGYLGRKAGRGFHMYET